MSAFSWLFYLTKYLFSNTLEAELDLLNNG